MQTDRGVMDVDNMRTTSASGVALNMDEMASEATNNAIVIIDDKMTTLMMALTKYASALPFFDLESTVSRKTKFSTPCRASVAAIEVIVKASIYMPTPEAPSARAINTLKINDDATLSVLTQRA